MLKATLADKPLIIDLITNFTCSKKNRISFVLPKYFHSTSFQLSLHVQLPLQFA